MSQTTADPAQTQPRPQSRAAVPAGWYPDPQGSPQRRWWNGDAWTHALEPVAPEPVEPVPVAEAPAAPWANLPGPSVRGPSSAAPTVHRALAADASESTAASENTAAFPTRRQLREQEAEAARAAEFAASFATPTATSEPAPEPAAAVAVAVAVAPEPAPRAAIPPRPARPERESTVFVMGPIEPAVAAESGPQEPAAQPLPEPVSVVPDPVSVVPDPVSVVPEPVSVVPEPALPSPVAAGSSPSAGGRPTVVASDYGLPATGAASVGAGTGAGTGTGTGSSFESVFPLDLAPASSTATAPGATGSPAMAGAGTRTRTVRSYTAEVWLIVALPVLVLGAAWALATYAPEQYTLGPQAGIAALLLLGSLVLAMRDRRELTFGHHARTASPLWALLTPVAYLAARAVSTRRETGRGWAPLVALVLIGAFIAAAAYFTPLSLAPMLTGLGTL